MEYLTITPNPDVNKKINESILSEKEYSFKINEKNYTLIISNYNSYINFKFTESNIIIFVCYENKYTLEQINHLLDLDSNKNYEEILELINDAYLNKQIYIIFEKDCSIRLIIKIIIKNKENKINIKLVRKDLDINEKFEILVNEINYLKDEKKDSKKEKINEIQKSLYDINNLVNEKLKEKSNTINILENKIESIEESLLIYKNQMNILINEIIELKNKSKISEKKKIKYYKEDLPLNILICGIKIDKSYMSQFLKEKNKIKFQKRDDYEEYSYYYGWKFKFFKEGLEKNNLNIIYNNIKQNNLNNNVLVCFINDSLTKAFEIINYFGLNCPKSDIFIIFLTINRNITKNILKEYIIINNINYDERNLDLIYYNNNDISYLFKLLFSKSCYFNQIGNDLKVPDINKNLIEKSIKEKESFNILVTGRPGVGKSTFVNILNGGKYAKEGEEEKKTTKKITSYYLNNTNFVLYDTPGIKDSSDLQKFNELMEEEITNMKTKKERFNCIIYMIKNNSKNLFNSIEISFLSKLLLYKIPIYIVINHSYMKNDIIKILIEEKVKLTFDKLAEYIKVFNINLLINIIKIGCGSFINNSFGLDEFFYDLYKNYKSYDFNQFNNDYSLVENVKNFNNNIENMDYYRQLFLNSEDYINLNIDNAKINKNIPKRNIIEEKMINKIAELYLKEFSLNNELIIHHNTISNMELYGLKIPEIKEIFFKIKNDLYDNNIISNYRQNEDNLRNYYDEKTLEEEKRNYFQNFNILINSTINLISKEKYLYQILNSFNNDNNNILLNILINDYFSIIFYEIFIKNKNKIFKKYNEIIIIDKSNFENCKKFFNLIINTKNIIYNNHFEENNNSKSIIRQLSEVINWIESYIEEISLIYLIYLKLSQKIPELYEKLEIMIKNNNDKYEKSTRNNKYIFFVNNIFFIIINSILSIIISNDEIYRIYKEELTILINLFKESFNILLQLENDLSLNIEKIKTLKIILELIEGFKIKGKLDEKNILQIINYFKFDYDYYKDSKKLCNNFNKFYEFLIIELDIDNEKKLNFYKNLNSLFLNEYEKYSFNEFRLLLLEKILEKNNFIKNSSQIIKSILDLIKSEPQDMLNNLEKLKNNKSVILKILNNNKNIFLEETIINIIEGKINIYFDLIKELNSDIKQKLYPKYFKDNKDLYEVENETGIIFDNSLILFKQTVQFLDELLDKNNNNKGNLFLCKLYSISYIKIYLSKAVLIIKEKFVEINNSNKITRVFHEIKNKNFANVLKIYVFRNFYYLLDNNYKKFINYNFKEKGIDFFYEFNFNLNKTNYLFFDLDNENNNYYEELNYYENIKKSCFNCSPEIFEKFIEKKGFDVFLIISINDVIYNLINLNQNYIYKNFCSFSISLFKKCTDNNNLIKLLFLLFDFKTYNEETKKKLINLNNGFIDEELFEMILFGFRYCVNSLNTIKEGKYLFRDILSQEINNAISQSIIPGIDSNEDLHLKTLENIILHFKSHQDNFGCYVCSCGFYYQIAPCGFPTIGHTSPCPNCGLLLGYGKKKINIGYPNQGMVRRKGHYRIFKDSNQKQREMERYHENDINIPNMILEDYINIIIEPIQENIKLGFQPLSKKFFISKNKKVRKLSTIGYRLLNYISYSHLFYSYLLGNISEENMKKNLIESMNILTIIQKDWELLRESLREKNIESIIIFMNMIFKKLSTLIKKCKYITTFKELNEFENEVEKLIDNCIKLYPEYKEKFNKEKKEILKIDSYIMGSILTELIQRDDKIFKDEEKFPMVKYFFYTKYNKEEDIIKNIQNMDKTEKYPILNQLLNNMSLFKKLKYLPNFNEFSNYMIKNYSFKISRDEAKNIKLKNEDIFNNNKFNEKYKNFLEIWKFIKNDTIKYKCYEKMPIKAFNSEDNLAYYLNDDKEIGYGMYFSAAFENFINWQNTFLNHIINSNKSEGILNHYINNINKAIKIQEAKNNQILLIEDSFSNSKYINLKDIIYSFSQRNIFDDKGKINYLNYNSYTYDFDAIEEELGKIILPGLRLFKNDLNFVTYSGEEFKGKRSPLLLNFDLKYTQKDLTDSERELIINYIKRINKNKYNFQPFYEMIKMIIIYLTEIEIMNENEIIFNLFEKSLLYFKFSDDCKDFLLELGNLKISKIIDILLIFEHLSFENLIENLCNEYKKEISEEIVSKLKYKIDEKEFNNNLFNIKDLSSAVRRYISRYLIGNIQEIDINEKRNLIFELTRKDLWKENIFNLENFEKNLSSQFSGYELKVEQAYSFYKLIGKEDEEELRQYI